MTAAQNRKRRETQAAEATVEKQVKTLQNRYDAAGQGRRMRAWNPESSGPNRALVGLQNIRNRSSDTVRNDWAGASGLLNWTTNLIGTGIVPRPKRIKAKKKKQALVELWDEWCKVCDADGVLDFYGMQTLATRSWLERGEVFLRLRPRRIDSGMTVPLQIQLIEADYVPLWDADTDPRMPVGNRIRQGIELSRSGERVAYWVYKDHPGDSTRGFVGDSSLLIRVAKSQMLHMFEPKRSGQLRGVPDNAAVLPHLRTLGDYGDAVMERQKLANLFVGGIEKASLLGGQDTVDPVTGQQIVSEQGGGASIGLQPGVLLDLDPGDKLVFSNPPEPGTMYHEYMRSNNLGTAAGQGLPYELLTGDIRDVSDRSLRVKMNEFRRLAGQRQWQIIIPQMCQPIRAAFVQAAILVGLIAANDEKDATLVEWAPQGWPYIHPVQDVQAKDEEVKAGFRSRSSVIGERGDDPEAVDDEIAADNKRAKDLDILQEPVDAAGKKMAAKKDADGIAPGEYPRNARERAADVANQEAQTKLLNAQASYYANGGDRPTNEPTSSERMLTNLAAVLAKSQADTAAMMQQFMVVAQALVDRPLVTQVAAPNVTTNVAAPAVTVPVTVEPTPINNTVNVEPTPLVIENKIDEIAVQLPDRHTTSVIDRDPNTGDIINVEQTERTIN